MTDFSFYSRCCKQFWVIYFYAFLLSTQSLLANDINIALHGLENTHYHRLTSTIADQTYHIFIRLPEGFSADEKYPAVYLLDGGITFPILGGYYKYLELAKEIPATIIVGISYGTSDWQKGNNRSRDFTAKSDERSYWGGAGNFQKVFSEEIFPLVESNYGADPARRIIFGQSLGGQFVLFTAQTAPDLFWGHIASNPALHRNLDFFLNTVPDNAGSTAKPRLFVSSAASDDPVFRGPAVKWIQHWTVKTQVPWALKTITLDGHNHFSAAPEAFRQGLHWIFSNEN